MEGLAITVKHRLWSDSTNLSYKCNPKRWKASFFQSPEGYLDILFEIYNDDAISLKS